MKQEAALREIRAKYGDYIPKPMGIRDEYAVLCPFVSKPSRDGELYLLFEIRAAGIRQGGEVCFPGGRVEPGESDIECALRETEEELSIPRNEIEILGRIDYIYNQKGFLLRPILGKISAAGFDQIKPSPAEVADIFITPLDFFRNTKPDIYQYPLNPAPPENFPYDKIGVPPSYPWSSGLVEVPVWYWQNHAVWGMTARITREIIRGLRAI